MEIAERHFIDLDVSCDYLNFQYLTPKVHWRKVISPETKKVVLSTSLMTSVLFAKHMGPLRMNGTAKVPPNMVK